MRTPRQKFYDSVYYGFERRLMVFCINLKKWQSMRKVKLDKSFYDAYKNQVLPYWSQFHIKPKVWWYKHYYRLTGTVNPKFIPDDLHLRDIIPHFDTELYYRQLTDKNLHGLMFPTVKRPETVFKKVDGRYCEDNFAPITKEEAFSRCARDGSFIVKPTRDTGAGFNIQFFSGPQDTEAMEKITGLYKGDDYIIQKTVVQHPALAKFNDSSVNTIRLVTLALPSGTHILSSVLRVGSPGSRVDNISQGGYQAVIRPDGTLDKLAYTHRGGQNQFVEETLSGIRFEGYQIPSWETLRDTALDLATRLPHLKLIGWDFSVDEHGDVVLIEFNCQLGQNQATCGPTFGDLTDEVLSEVYAKRMKKK